MANPLSSALSQPYLGGSTSFTKPEPPGKGPVGAAYYNANLKPTAPVAPTNDSAFLDAYLKQLSAATAAANRQYEAMPRLPYYDISAAYDKARAQANAAVTPYYTKKINDYIAEYARQREVAKGSAALSTEQADTELANLQSGNALQQTRTGEDTQTNIDKLANQEQQFQQSEGTAFDKERRQSDAALAASGLATSGLGQQSAGEQIANRNQASSAQEQDFQAKKDATELLKNRTFEDIVRSNKLGTEKNAFTKKNIQFDLTNEINRLNFEDAQKQDEIRKQQLADAAAQTQDYYNQNTRQALAAMKLRPQDYQVALQTYL